MGRGNLLNDRCCAHENLGENATGNTAVLAPLASQHLQISRFLVQSFCEGDITVLAKELNRLVRDKVVRCNTKCEGNSVGRPLCVLNSTLPPEALESAGAQAPCWEWPGTAWHFTGCRSRGISTYYCV